MPQQYKRLPGIKRGLAGYETLWMGSDHLLSVYSVSFSETYKRFYYADIQAFITRRTAAGKILNILYGILGGASLILYFQSSKAYWQNFFGMGAIVFLFLLLVNWLRGPTCICHLKTAVQTENLPSLNRVKNIQKILGMLKPKIEKAQE
jgi:hypothetical protein